jgi:hypothetical protein
VGIALARDNRGGMKILLYFVPKRERHIAGLKGRNCLAGRAARFASCKNRTALEMLYSRPFPIEQ